MLAIVNTPRGPDPAAIREVAEPELRPNEALVAVRAFSLNRGELRLFQVRPQGWRPGQDIAGIVLEAAADGSGPPAGTRVVALCDEAGWAERAAVPSDRMAPLADNVSVAAAAALPVAGLTALRTLRHGAPLLGKRVLITGAAGGVGNLAVQLALRSGARVTAGRRQPRARPGSRRARRRRDRDRHHRAAGPLRAHSRKRRRRLPDRRDRAHRGTRHDRRLWQLLGRAHRDQFSRLRRAPERPHSGLPLFHVGARGTLRPRSRRACRADRRWLAEAALRRI